MNNKEIIEALKIALEKLNNVHHSLVLRNLLEVESPLCDSINEIDNILEYFEDIEEDN